MSRLPVKPIASPADLENFKTSPTFIELLEFIRLCGDTVVGISISSLTENVIPDTVQKIETFMGLLYNLVDEIPPLNQPMRFGNKAFRTWYDRLQQEVPIFLNELLNSVNGTAPNEASQHHSEIAQYLLTAFGNETRIDYGTGHELNFALFLLCLFKLKLVVQTDLKYAILRGFTSYIRTMRRLQEVYMLEPAGSHGVWGLDDYHCLLFVWGAAQLCGHASLRPSSIHDREVMEDVAVTGDYLYLEGIRFIQRIKRGAPFAESSPMLNDISALNDWVQVYKGLFRLFQGEVLLKLPVAQHISFGALIPCTWKATSDAVEAEAVAPVAHAGLTRRPVNPNSFATAAPWAAPSSSSSSSRR